ERASTPAGGEPGAAVWSDGGGSARQRSVLLWSHAAVGRGGTSGVESTHVRRGRGELPHRRPPRHSRLTVLAPVRRDSRHPTRPRAPATHGTRRARPIRRRPFPAGPVPRHHRAPLRQSTQRRVVAGRDGAGGGGAWARPAGSATGDGAALPRVPAERGTGAHLAVPGLIGRRAPASAGLGGLCLCRGVGGVGGVTRRAWARHGRLGR